MKKEKATLKINRELHRELKIEAAKERMKMSELAERLLRNGLRKSHEEREEKR